MDYLAGFDIVVPVTLSGRNGEPTVPTSGSVTYTLYDSAGLPIAGHTDQPIVTGPTDSMVEIALPASVNGLGAARFSKRTLVVRYLSGGKRYSQQVHYRLLPFINTVITPAKVRAYIGVNQHELPDHEIDVPSAYFKIEERVTSIILSAALAAGTITEIRANEAILYQAVLDCLPGLRQRVAQKETNGPIGFDRPPMKDFCELWMYTAAKLDEAIGAVSGAVATTDTPIFSITTQVDPVTGA